MEMNLPRLSEISLKSVGSQRLGFDIPENYESKSPPSYSAEVWVNHVDNITQVLQELLSDI